MHMTITIKKLMEGDQEIVSYYQKAKDMWADIWKMNINEELLIKVLGSEQYRFEEECGGRHLGQEIMVWSGFNYLLHENEKDAYNKIELLKKAFNKAHLSLEVSSDAKDAIKLFNLEDD